MNGVIDPVYMCFMGWLQLNSNLRVCRFGHAGRVMLFEYISTFPHDPGRRPYVSTCCKCRQFVAEKSAH